MVSDAVDTVGTAVLLAAAPAGRGRAMDAASVLPALAAVPPSVLTGTPAATVVELADPLDPQTVLTRLRAAAATPGPLAVYLAGQLHLDRRQHLPHLALARTTTTTLRYTGLPWHWLAGELAVRAPGTTTVVADLVAEAELWQRLTAAPGLLFLGSGPLLYGRVAPAPRRGEPATPEYLRTFATVWRSGARPSLADLHRRAAEAVADEGGGQALLLTPEPHAGGPVVTPGPAVSPVVCHAPAPVATPGPAVSPAPTLAFARGSAQGQAQGPVPAAGPGPLPDAPPFQGGQSAASGAAAGVPPVSAGRTMRLTTARVKEAPAAGRPPATGPATANPAPLTAPAVADVVAAGGSAVVAHPADGAPAPAEAHAPGVEEAADHRGTGRAPAGSGRGADGGAPAGNGTVPASPAPAHDPHREILAAAQAGRHGEAIAVAAAWEREALRRHGARSQEAVHWMEVRADLARLAGDPARSCELWISAAQARLGLRQGPGDPDVEGAVDRAHHQWEQIEDPARAGELGPVLYALRRQVPGRQPGALAALRRRMR
ncbi:hypothetical protein ACWGIN_19270 [Streptomyces sp. NPDC054861]